MNVRQVLRQLIDRTKSGTIVWDAVPKTEYYKLVFNYDQISSAFRTRVQNRYFVLWLVNRMQVVDGETIIQGTYPCLSLADDNFTKQFDFTEDEFGDDSDLYRLLRLVERRVHKVDEFLEDFLKGQ